MTTVQPHPLLAPSSVPRLTFHRLLVTVVYVRCEFLEAPSGSRLKDYEVTTHFSDEKTAIRYMRRLIKNGEALLNTVEMVIENRSVMTDGRLYTYNALEADFMAGGVIRWNLDRHSDRPKRKGAKSISFVSASHGHPATHLKSDYLSFTL